MKALLNFCGRRGGRVLLLLCSLGLTQPVSAMEGEGIIDEIQVNKGSIHISFTEPAQVVGHTPKSKGDRLYIDLKLTSNEARTSDSPQQQQESYKASSKSPLTLVSYRKETRGDARLELRFARQVDFDIAAHSDFRGVTVTLAGASVKGSATVEAQANLLMEQARKALVDEKNPQKASNLYQQVIDLPANSATREAYEYMGLAQERLGNMTSAENLYKKYLKRYPDGADSERVSQRLASLQTATSRDKKELRKAESRKEQNPWQFYGGLSQYYLYDTIDTKTDVNTVSETANFLQTDVDLNVRRRVGGSDSRFRLSYGHDANLDDSTDSSSVRYLYAEHSERKLGLLARLGRQASSRDGVLTRFDGLRLAYTATQGVTVTAVAGSPVISTREAMDDKRSFTGLSVELGPYMGNLEFTAYALNQDASSMTDRRSVGGEARYFSQNLTLLGMFDYDTFYSETNLAMLIANWTLQNKVNLNANVSMRKAPFITTSNALLGSIYDDVKDLQTVYTNDEIYQLARDRTADSQNITIGASYPLRKNVRIYGDVSVLSSSGTPEIATSTAFPATPVGVVANEASGDEYYYSLRMVGNGIIRNDDVTTVGLRMFNGKEMNSTGISASVRLRYKKKWMLYPTVQYDTVDWTATGTSQNKLGLRFRGEYAWRENMAFEAEFGTTFSDQDIPDDPSETSIGNYVDIGYRYNF